MPHERLCRLSRARRPYGEYDKDYHRRKGADADQPHRIKYRRIDA